jgi:hypothetical protein
LINGDEMTFLEIHYAAGVGAPLHTHTHESIAYVVRGKVKSTVGSEEFIMGPGDVCRHPKGVLHGLEALEDSVVVEIKAPAPDINAFFAKRTQRKVTHGCRRNGAQGSGSGRAHEPPRTAQRAQHRDAADAGQNLERVQARQGA